MSDDVGRGWAGTPGQRMNVMRRARRRALTALFVAAATVLGLTGPAGAEPGGPSAPVIGVTGTQTSSRIAVSVGNTLRANQKLVPGRWLASTGEQYFGVILRDGKKLGFAVNTPCGSYPIVPSAYAKAYTWMKADGNLVFVGDSKVVWESKTAGNPGAYLIMQPTGDLQVRAKNGHVLWTYDGSCNNLPSWPTGSPATLYPGHYLASSNRAFKLVMKRDGNLVLVNGKRVLWSSRTASRGNTDSRLVYRNDGTLYLVNIGRRVIWKVRDKNTAKNPLFLLVSNSGFFGIVRVTKDDKGNIVSTKVIRTFYPGG